MALGFLGASIWHARFLYIASEPDLLSYALDLAEAEADAESVQEAARVAQTAEQTPTAAGDPESGVTEKADAKQPDNPILAEHEADALTVFKNHLVRQYAAATDNNRQINQRRAQRRTWAGLCTLVSILATLGLVGATMYSRMEGATRAPAGVQSHEREGQSQQSDGRISASRSEERRDPSGAQRGLRSVVVPGAGPASEDAPSVEGMVRDQRAPDIDSEVREQGP